jgi:hypothetical protein
MYSFRRLILPALSGLFLFSCSTASSDKQPLDPHAATASTAPAASQLREQAIAFDKKVKEATQLDRSTAIMAVKNFTDYAYAFPSDTLAPEFLFKAADISHGALQEYKQSLAYYRIITDKYPAYKKCAFALMRQAMIYDDDIEGGDEQAKLLYQQVIKKYPNTLFAQQATLLMDQLGKTSQQMIREFEHKNKSTTKPTESANPGKEKSNAVRFVFPSILLSEDARLG